MQNHIRNTNLRFNLDKDQQRKAWEYLQTMDRQNFKSYSQVISLETLSAPRRTSARRAVLRSTSALQARRWAQTRHWAC